MANKKLINMNGDTTDIFYRYKMPEVNIVKQGAFYAFTNIEELCKKKYLNRDILDIKRYLNKYFSTNWSYKNNNFITSAPVTQKRLQQSIFDYVNKFICCSMCNSPETIKDKDKDRNICSACGNIDNLTDNGVIRKKKMEKINKPYIVPVNELIESNDNTNIIIDKEPSITDIDDLTEMINNNIKKRTVTNSQKKTSGW